MKFLYILKLSCKSKALTYHVRGPQDDILRGTLQGERNKQELVLTQSEYSEHRCDTFGKLIVEARRLSGYYHPKEHDSAMDVMCPTRMNV